MHILTYLIVLLCIMIFFDKTLAFGFGFGILILVTNSLFKKIEQDIFGLTILGLLFCSGIVIYLKYTYFGIGIILSLTLYFLVGEVNNRNQSKIG